jgi:hypothetical protein
MSSYYSAHPYFSNIFEHLSFKSKSWTIPVKINKSLARNKIETKALNKQEVKEASKQRKHF